MNVSSLWYDSLLGLDRNPRAAHLISKARKRLQTVSHYWCTISLNRLVQFSLRHLANRAVWFRRSKPRFAPIVYRYLDIRRWNPEISLKTLLTS